MPALVAILLAASTARVAGAQGGVMLQGVADAEFWKTDSGSVLLTRNRGRPSALGRVQLWGAVDLGHHLTAYAAGTGEGGRGRHDVDETAEWYTDQLGLRYAPSAAFILDAGKMPSPVGMFASRRFSMRNPLIGMPDGYPVQYPYGAQASGTLGRVDYRAAVVSLPVYHEDYTPDPSAAPRPALGFGFTPTVGVRFGASGTWGPYLGRDVSNDALAGRSWRAYRQRVGALDAEVSRGYLELHAELAAASYDVPAEGGARAAVHGVTYYGEAKYTLTPRLFVAGRLERNDYPFVQPGDSPAWTATPVNVYNGEAGAGFRIDARTLVKATVRADQWRVSPELRAFLPNGSAFAFQLSRTFDAADAISRIH